PLYAGQVGPRGNVVASRLAREADVILALGTRLGFNTTFYSYDNLARDAKIVQVEIEPTALGRFFPIEVGVHGDAGRVADQLRDAIGAAHAPSPAVLAWRDGFRAGRAGLLEERRTAA